MLGKRINNMKKFLEDDYIYSIPNERPYETVSDKWGKAFRATISSIIKRDGYRIENFSIGFCYVSGFITNNDKYVYFSTSDFRFFKDEWYTNILVRTAQHNKDYSGGMNRYTTLEDFGDKVRAMLGDD